LYEQCEFIRSHLFTQLWMFADGGPYQCLGLTLGCVVFEIKVLIAASGISILVKNQITSLSPVRLQQMANS